MRSKRSVGTAPHCAPRQGWAEAFAASRPVHREMLLEPLPPNAFDEEEWEWDSFDTGEDRKTEPGTES